MPTAKRRQPVKNKPGIYFTETAQGAKRYEFTFRDSDGKQRWQTVKDGGSAPPNAPRATRWHGWARARRSGRCAG